MPSRLLRNPSFLQLSGLLKNPTSLSLVCAGALQLSDWSSVTSGWVHTQRRSGSSKGDEAWPKVYCREGSAGSYAAIDSVELAVAQLGLLCVKQTAREQQSWPSRPAQVANLQLTGQDLSSRASIARLQAEPAAPSRELFSRGLCLQMRSASWDPKVALCSTGTITCFHPTSQPQDGPTAPQPSPL